MSGGTWEYLQYRYTDVIEDIERLIRKNGKLKTSNELKEESWREFDWYKKYPEDKYHHKYSDEVIEKFKEGLEVIKRAQIYMQRLDYLIAGDDGEDSFLERLEDELNKLNDGKS